MTDETDAETLLRRLKEGDQQALASLYVLDRDRLRKMVEFRLDHRLRGRVSPSDILQEAYIDALKRLPHFLADPDVPFYIWMRSVTMQRLVDAHRQHLGAQARSVAKETPIVQGAGIEASTEKMAELMGDLTSPSQVVHRGEVLAQVRLALEGLDPIDREVLALRHFEELSNREVAALLGIQPPAASKRYLRAIERLREALEKMPGMDGEAP